VHTERCDAIGNRCGRTLALGHAAKFKLRRKDLQQCPPPTPTENTLRPSSMA
jgi:hypothetical protein